MRHQSKILNVLLLTGLCACASPTPQLDERFGQAVEAAKAHQTRDLQAASKASADDGLDGAGANESVQRYRDSFKAPPPTFVIINAAPGGGR
jgi:hypothetical protein